MRRVLLSGVLFLVACNGTDFINTEVEVDPVDTVRGAIVSTDGEAIAGAVVRINDIVTSTDPSGRYSITVPLIGEPVDLWVTADGYSTGHRKLPQGAVTANVAIQQMKSATVDADAGGTMFGDDGLIVTFPEAAFVHADGSAVTGEVTVSWSLLNRPDQIAAAPGNMVAVAGGQELLLESFGMAEVTVSQDGEEVELAAPAELQIPLSETAQFMHGDEVGLWHFDEALGVWTEEGTGTIEGRMFVADVPHFSSWNCDQPMRTTCFSGRLVNPEGQPIEAGSVVSEGVDYMGMGSSYLSPEGDGHFNVPVRVASVAKLQLSTGWGNEDDYIIQEWVGLELATQTDATGSQNCKALGTLVAHNVYRDFDGDNWSPWDGDCDDNNPEVHPEAETPPCSDIDMDCDGIASLNPGPDEDGDGFGSCEDCDDTNMAVYPNAPQLCDGTADNDCDGLVDAAEADGDGDGLSTCAGDCDDNIAGAAASCLLSQIQLDARGGCGVRADGRVHCWGALSPPGLPQGSIASVAVDAQKVCVRDLLGTLQCYAGGDPWTVPYAGLGGLDGFGDRMAGIDPYTGGVRFLASTQSTSVAPGGIARIAVGAEHVCVDRTDGTVSCDGGPYAAPSGSYSDVVSGDGFSCALNSAGEAACWGPEVPSGQLAGSFATLTAGASHVCGLSAAGDVSCWGANDSAQTDAPTGAFTSLSAGGDTTCGVFGSASVVCWGANDFGQAQPFGVPAD